MYRPQFAMPQAPQGFVWQPCIFQFDMTNLPALGSLTLTAGQVSGYIPLGLDPDAPFLLLAVRMSNPGVNVLLFDPWSNQLMDDFVEPPLYGGELLITALEGGIDVPRGAVFSVRLQGQ
jgi:hypothetical protein